MALWPLLLPLASSSILYLAHYTLITVVYSEFLWISLYLLPEESFFLSVETILLDFI